MSLTSEMVSPVIVEERLLDVGKSETSGPIGLAIFPTKKASFVVLMIVNDGHVSVLFPMLVWNYKVFHKHYDPVHAHNSSDFCGIFSSAYVLYLEFLCALCLFQ